MQRPLPRRQQIQDSLSQKRRHLGLQPRRRTRAPKPKYYPVHSPRRREDTPCGAQSRLERVRARARGRPIRRHRDRRERGQTVHYLQMYGLHWVRQRDRPHDDRGTANSPCCPQKREAGNSLLLHDPVVRLSRHDSEGVRTATRQTAARGK